MLQLQAQLHRYSLFSNHLVLESHSHLLLALTPRWVFFVKADSQRDLLITYQKPFATPASVSRKGTIANDNPESTSPAWAALLCRMFFRWVPQGDMNGIKIDWELSQGWKWAAVVTKKVAIKIRIAVRLHYQYFNGISWPIPSSPSDTHG